MCVCGLLSACSPELPSEHSRPLSLACSALEFGTRSQINLPIAVFIGLMIIPMMMKVDFTAIQAVGKTKTPRTHWFRFLSMT